ncbi:MAG TPA: ABC transporter permease [Bacteroidales bacterium]|nr:ABC transporter permease [Bacteroidales bacterium]HRX96425.1 ABC transporter permease [Bacteroidales bacterium]
MFDRDRWQEIFHTLSKNKIRTFMTAFGVFWGIFMLIIMLGSGTGLENGVTEGMGNFATNSVFVWTQRTTMPYKGFPRGRRFYFRNDDIKALRDNIPEIKYLAPKMQGWSSGDGTNNTVRNDKTGAFSIMGEYPDWNKIDPMDITEGRFINQTDIEQKRKVAVIGTRVKELLFDPDEDPIGEYIRIQGVYFQVVGVFVPLNTNINFGGEKEQSIFIPLSTLQQTYNYGDIVGWFSITSVDEVPASEVEEKAIAFLAARHTINPDDKEAFGHFNLEEEFQQMKGLFTGIAGLIWIVGIGTLIAGVIGITNIMLVIVKERTKEIGIQRAIGATPVQIMSQVITESVFLTSVAGYFGLAAGVGLVELINYLLVKFNASNEMFQRPEVDFKIAIISLLILIISGAIAGLIPARRAIRIKPIDALRDE